MCKNVDDTCLILRVSCFDIVRKTCVLCCVGRRALLWATGGRGSNGTGVRGSNGTGVTDLSAFRFFFVCRKEDGKLELGIPYRLPVQTDTSLGIPYRLPVQTDTSPGV